MSRIHRIAVLPFDGAGGPSVTDEFVRQLLASGLEVSDRAAGVDAVLSGAVTDYKPGDKLMVVLGKTSTVNAAGQTVEVVNPVVSLNGSQVTPELSGADSPHSQIVAVQAAIGIAVRLVHPGDANALWADEYSYEGLDIQDAVQATVSVLMASLRHRMTQASRPGGTF